MRRSQRKKIIAILLLLIVTATSGCALLPGGLTRQQPTNEPGVSRSLLSPYLYAEHANKYFTYQEQERKWALYYRMSDENFLVRVMRSCDINKSLEESLIEALIKGPERGLKDLTGVFHTDTRIIRTDSEGDTLLLTLSYHFLEAPSEAPPDLQANPRHIRPKSDIYLQRRLALASIVSTITEETQYTAVQLIVTSDENDTLGRRISKADLFESEPDEPDELLAQEKRSEEYLLTHYNAAEIILNSIKSKKYNTLYKFVSGSPSESKFFFEMYDYDYALMDFTLSSGMVSNDGQNAILIADLHFESAGGERYVEQYSMRIEQENSLWKIKYETLKRMLEAT